LARYAAPEVFTRLSKNDAGDLEDFQMADVYSFGILVWEALHRQIPWGEKTESEVWFSTFPINPPFLYPLCSQILQKTRKFGAKL